MVEPLTNKVENLWLKWKNSTFLIPTDPPTPDVCQLSSGNPCAACVALETFDALDESFDQNEDLVEDRQSLVRQINDRHDPLSYYLPFELAMKIFMIYYDDTGYMDSVQSRANPIPHTTTPLRLASVCTRWRDIAFNIPSLWSSLRISYNPLWHTQSNPVAQWLDRAGARPLFIRIVFAENYEYTKRSRRSIAPLFDAVRRYADRWKVLNLFIPSKLCKSFLGKFPLDAPLLETLQLDISNVKYIDASPIATLTTPRLKKLHMWRLWLTTVEVDWANLTSVRATRPSVDEIFEILTRAPGLLECAFSDICDDSFVYIIPAIFNHASVRSLKLFPKDYMEGDVMSALFERLIFPSLQRLTYDFKRSLIPLDLDIFSAFLTRSGRAITYLSLENIEFHCISPAFIIAILELLPAITELYLKCWETEPPWRTLPDSLFQRFVSPSMYNPNDNFLPNLQYLVYRGLKPNHNAWQTLEFALLHLATTLEESSAVLFNATQENKGRTPRPLRAVHFTLINNLPNDEVVTIPVEVFRHLLRIQKGGINLKITEESRGRQDNIEELDMLLHFIARTFSEFDDFPAYWFNDQLLE